MAIFLLVRTLREGGGAIRPTPTIHVARQCCVQITLAPKSASTF
jgi:hypothetical protein